MVFRTDERRMYGAGKASAEDTRGGVGVGPGGSPVRPWRVSRSLPSHQLLAVSWPARVESRPVHFQTSRPVRYPDWYGVSELVGRVHARVRQRKVEGNHPQPRCQDQADALDPPSRQRSRHHSCLRHRSLVNLCPPPLMPDFCLKKTRESNSSSERGESQQAKGGRGRLQAVQRKRR